MTGIINAIVFCVLVCGAFYTSAFGQSIQTGLAFLKLGAGADAIARGSAMTATATGAEALFYNPAGLAQSSGSSVMMMHNQNIFGVSNDILGSAVALGDWSLGLGIQAASVNGIQIRDAATDNPIGTFTSIDGALTFGAAVKLSDEVSVGMNLKALIEKIYINDAFGAVVDFGGIYRPANTNFIFGIALQNIGAMGVLNDEAVAVPAGIRGGGAYTGTIGAASNLCTYTASLDIIKTYADAGFHLLCGVELAYNSTFFFRAGYGTGFDASGFSTGVGVKYHFLQFDYALSPYSQQYGTANTLSIKIDL